MDKAEYQSKQDRANQKKREANEEAYRDQLIATLQRIAEQDEAIESQAGRADTFHRRVEKLTLRLEGRKYWLEVAETLGLWVAAGVGVAAIIVASHDSDNQTKIMHQQQIAMQGQLIEMKATGAQTDQMIETNRKLAEAATKQAEAAIETVRTARDNLVASQRAWVGPRNARSDGQPELGKEFTVFIDYQNSGREPGIETIYDVDVFAISDDEDRAGKTNQRVITFNSKCKIKWTPSNAQVVYPTPGGLLSAGYSLFKNIDAGQIDQEVVEGTKTVVVNGCFVYKTSGAIHRSSYCYYFNMKKSKPAAWNICEFGNDAD
jgi:hypothetical protein